MTTEPAPNPPYKPPHGHAYLPSFTGVKPGAGAATTAPPAKRAAAADPKAAQSLLDYLLGQ